MLRPWQRERRVGLAPDRLVLAPAPRPLDGTMIESLRNVGSGKPVTVVLSNHLVRYAVLPWSPALGSDEEWLAYANHTFVSSYGNAAAAWTVRVSRGGRGAARVASAIDTALFESLRQVPEVASIQPYLMTAFNGRRRALEGRNAWFVLQEPGRITVSFVSQGEWKSVRSRQAGEDWQASLPEQLDREYAMSGEALDCDEVLLYCESEPPPKLGRYRVTDITLPRGAGRESRPLAMTLH